MGTLSDAIPSRLFRFRNFTSGEHRGRGKFDYQELFDHGRLYFSRPEFFNDPFDCLPAEFHAALNSKAQRVASESYRMSGSEGEPPKELLEIAKEECSRELLAQTPDSAKHLRLRRRASGNWLGVLCLVKSVNSNVMWAHYANDHKGFAVELDLESMPMVRFKPNLKEVKYSKDRPQAGEDVRLNLYYRKAAEWSYEQEWRIIVQRFGLDLVFGPKGQCDFVTLERGSITGVFLGWNFAPDDEKGMILPVLAKFSERNPDVPFFQMQPNEANFDMNPVPIRVEERRIVLPGNTSVWRPVQTDPLALIRVRTGNKQAGMLQPSFAPTLVQRVRKRWLERPRPSNEGSGGGHLG
ncbi:MAG: hypothetical protein RIS76_1888 [Verrucomicrobiota bacterium]